MAAAALSAYDMKNNCCVLVKGLFKVQKNDVFLFGISFFFVLEILTFLYYAIICIIQNVNISKKKKDIPKGKRHSSVF